MLDTVESIVEQAPHDAVATVEPILDAAEAERAATAKEIARIEGEIRLYEKAAAEVQRQISDMETRHLQPIRHEVGTMRLALEREHAKAALADHIALAPGSEQRRAAMCQELQQIALASYRRAQSTAGSPKTLIEQTWNSLLEPFQREKQTIGSTSQAGVFVSADQHLANFCPRFRALARRMDELAGLSVERGIALEADAQRRAQYGLPVV